MIKKVSLCLALLLFANISCAELKIGFVNARLFLDKGAQVEKAKQRLEKEFKPRDKQLISKQKEIQNMEEKLSRDASVMAESERRKLEREIIAKKRDVTRSKQEFSEDFNIRRNEELGKLQRRIFEAIKALAEEGNYDLMLTDGVIHASGKIDVTKQVLEKLSSMPQ